MSAVHCPLLRTLLHLSLCCRSIFLLLLLLLLLFFTNVRSRNNQRRLFLPISLIIAVRDQGQAGAFYPTADLRSNMHNASIVAAATHLLPAPPQIEDSTSSLTVSSERSDKAKNQ